jgi:trigger factor
MDAAAIFTRQEGMTLNPTETIETNELAETQPEAAITHEHTHDHDHDHDHSHTHDHGPSLNPDLMREIAVEVDADTVSKAFRGVVKKYQKLARIPGFRVGKVPESVIKSRFAKDVRQEVLDTLVSERFRQAIQEQKLSPISQPQLTNLFLVDGQPLQFKAAFEVLPTIDVTGYDTITVKKPEAELTEAEYTAELGRVMDNVGVVEPVDEDRPLVDGDWAEIQFKGQIKDLAQTVTEDGLESPDATEPITGENVLIEVGGSNTLAAFSEALRGSKIGQEMSFEVAYPADFGEPRLAGQTVGYDVSVTAIKKKTFPEKDEELAKQFGDYETWADFETSLRERAAANKKQSLENGAKESMLNELIGKFEFPVPETFVQQQIDARLDRGLRALANQGMTPEEMRKLDFARLRAAQRDQAIGEVKASLILDKISEAENIEVSDDELDREIFMMSLQGREPVEAVKARLSKDGGIDRMRDQMRREKTGTVLYEKMAS